MTAAPETYAFARALSRILGWIYTLSWSLSFYPQPIHNYQRRTTQGLAIDFPTANVLGFTSYTTFTAAFLFSPLVRSQYAYRNPKSPIPTVQYNDFAFAVHGLVLCLITYSQFWPAVWGFKVEAWQKASAPLLGICFGGIFAVVIIALIVLFDGKGHGSYLNGWAWIDVIYALGYLKLCMTIVKYVPQVWVNYKRKSTVGWSIIQILLDFAGGILSILQLVIDSSLQTDFSGITGNPAKLGLGLISIVLDLIFMTQHYVLYRLGGNEMEGLVRNVEEQQLLDSANN